MSGSHTHHVEYSQVKSYRVAEFTGLHNLRVTVGAITAPLRGQVAVRMYAVSLNYRDVLVVNGKYPGPKATSGGGLVPCSDGAGQVVEVGEGVHSFKVGDRVVTAFHENWESGDPPQDLGSRSLGGSVHGTLAQIGVYEATALVHIPDTLSYEMAATLSCAPLTAWTALRDTPHPIGPHSTVVVQGTGGVSVFAAQLGVAAGARVIATSSSDVKLKALQQLGVAHCDLINYTKRDWVEAVRQLAPEGVDHIVEVTGQLSKSLQVIKKGGTVSVVGYIGGNEPVCATDVLWSSSTVRGVLVGSRHSLRQLLQAVEHSHIQPVIDRIFGFEQAREAYEYLSSQQHVGKVVIRVQSA